MAGVLAWLKKTSERVLDPGREQRISTLADQMQPYVFADREHFDLSRVALVLNIMPEDTPLVAERVYDRTLLRAWQDEAIGPRERQALNVVARVLRLTPAKAQELEFHRGVQVFEGSLARAIADGVFDAREIQRLHEIARGMGITVRELMLGHLAQQSEGIFRGMFTQIASSGQITAEEWNRLVHACESLGIRESELLNMIEPHAQRLVEHVLVDAKDDEELSEQEDQFLQWLIETLSLPGGFREYVTIEVANLRTLTQIRRGRLPSLACNAIATRSGEIVHYHGPAIYDQVKRLKSGTRVDRHDGFATITDSRLLFNSSTKVIDLNHRRVVAINPGSPHIEIQARGTGAGFYHFPVDHQFASLIYRVAINKANQTIVESGHGNEVSRHIPRDVRQRVWQRYGGRCAECSADQYLEYDHIVPVAKGGSNSDNNVQLLCRRCNLKKSDFI